MRIESFSAGYWLLPDFEVVAYDGNHAIIQDTEFFQILNEIDVPYLLGSAGGRHFRLNPEYSIPSGYVAVPRDSQYAARDGDALLIAKRSGLEAFQDV